MEPRRLFERPLIAGASVSADHFAVSPGKRLSLRYTPHGNIRTVAQGGTPGREIVRRLTEPVLADRSVVVAMDLFFWDSLAPDPQASRAALLSLVARTGARGTPVVIGNIPELLPGRQPSRRKLNALIRQQAGESPHCRVLDLDSLHRRVLRDGYLTIGARRRGLFDLIPDGLHLSDEAADHLADLVAHALGIAPGGAVGSLLAMPGARELTAEDASARP